MSVSGDRRLGVVKREVLVGARATPAHGRYSCGKGGDPAAPRHVPSQGHPHAWGLARGALPAPARRSSGLPEPPPCTPGDIWHRWCRGLRHPLPDHAAQNLQVIWPPPTKRSPMSPVPEGDGCSVALGAALQAWLAPGFAGLWWALAHPAQGLQRNWSRGQSSSHRLMPLPGDAAGRGPAAAGGEQIVRKKARQSLRSSSEQDLLRVFPPLPGPAGRLWGTGPLRGLRARSGWDAWSCLQVPPVLPGLGWGAGAASSGAVTSKSCQEEGDVCWPLGYWQLPLALKPESPSLSEGHPHGAGMEPGCGTSCDSERSQETQN